ESFPGCDSSVRPPPAAASGGQARARRSSAWSDRDEIEVTVYVRAVASLECLDYGTVEGRGDVAVDPGKRGVLSRNESLHGGRDGRPPREGNRKGDLVQAGQIVHDRKARTGDDGSVAVDQAADDPQVLFATRRAKLSARSQSDIPVHIQLVCRRGRADAHVAGKGKQDDVSTRSRIHDRKV